MFIKDKRGMSLIVVYLITTLLLIWGFALMFYSITEKKISDQEKDYIKALFLAEAGVADVKKSLYDTFNTYYLKNGQKVSLFEWFDDLYEGSENPNYDFPDNVSLGEGTYSIMLMAVNEIEGVDGRELTLQSTGNVNNVSRGITTVVRFGLEQSQVFNYSYFVNNWGWFVGGGIKSNGDVRSNGEFNFIGNLAVNGDIYADAITSIPGGDILGKESGLIEGLSRNDALDYYISQSGSRARPTNPTDINNPDATVYEAGYDGKSERFPKQNVLEMPYLGDLSNYQAIAQEREGTVSQGEEVIVNAVYAGKGPDNKANTPDDGSLILVGTTDAPIVINGPVVVNNDVIIKGTIKGQGTIYAGRNIHIVGDITYANPPDWPKPDQDPDSTDETNAGKDILGLAAKGNIIVGDYTRTDWRRNITPYIKPPVTAPYKVDSTDTGIGYVSYHIGDNPYFDGDYTDFDGGNKNTIWGIPTKRRYYESSLADVDIQKIATPSNKIREVSAIIYTNHALAGRVGSFSENGSAICRDEAIIYSGSITMNYDAWVYEGAEDLSLYMPRQLSQPRIVAWKE